MKNKIFKGFLSLLLLNATLCQQEITANAIIRDSAILLGAGLLLHTKASYNWASLKHFHGVPSFILRNFPDLAPIQPTAENNLSQVQATGINMGINTGICLSQKICTVISSWMNLRLFDSKHAIENNKGIVKNTAAHAIDTSKRFILNAIINYFFQSHNIQQAATAGGKALLEDGLKRFTHTIAYETVALICLSKAIPQLYNAL